MPNADVETLHNGMEAASERIFERRRHSKVEVAQQLGVPSPFISCSVGREVNAAADEYYDLARYQRAIGLANDGYIEHEDGRREPRYDFDDYGSTMVEPEKLHITHLHAADVGAIVLRHFADDRGILHKPKEVMKRISRFTKQYNQAERRHNEDTQGAIAYAKGFTPRAPRRMLGEDELQDESLAMLNGIFQTEGELEPFGRGNVFGIVLSAPARKFLRSERARALDMLTDIFGVRYLDRDIEDTIISKDHHMTLIRLGLKKPESEWELMTDGLEYAAPFPDTIVTQLDSKARAIIPK